MAGEKGITRRESLRKAGLLLGGAALTAAGAEVWHRTSPSPVTQPAKEKPMTTVSHERMPAIFLPHGGGPWPFTNKPLFGSPHMWDQMSSYMKGLGQIPPATPKGILVVSAHWEEAVPTVMSASKPPMLYDYYGFPPETYKVQWPSPGAPELAGEIQSLLENAGFKTGANGGRGFDHGMFVPLKLAYPNPTIPALQLSLKQGLDPKTHIKIGQALAPLRDRGIFIIGSGMSYHNLQVLISQARSGSTNVIDDSKAFDEWLVSSMLMEPDRRETKLVEWLNAPKARSCHPREEHLLPLHVIAGAAGNDKATIPYRDVVMNAYISAIHFG
ncbi:MAG: dioxygenase [Deltaproteobacteria bacterium]|nr:MAG: dioxygenase [Deltaproteobacteria bacterium]